MIVRSFMCDQCAFQITVELRSDEWDSPPPSCPRCAEQTHQDFQPVAIGGSNHARAAKIAETIASEDMNVADFTAKQGAPASVRYRDASITPSSWIGGNATLEAAIASGRQDRLQYGGNGLDVLQNALRTGDQPDLIAAAKRRSMKVW